MSDDWYSLSDLPPGIVRVRVRWYGREFVAVRGVHPKTRRLCWYQWDKDGQEARTLPPRGESWTPEPDRWQPEHPDKFWAKGKPRPEPLPVLVHPHMVYVKQGFGAVDAAESLEREREIDAERDDTDGWWRDITNVRYEPRGSVTERMCEGRLLRALAHCGASFARFRLRQRVTANLLVAISQEFAELEHEAERLGWGRLDAFRPLRPDEDDFDEAMRWFVSINPPDERKTGRKLGFSRRQRVLLMRSLDYPLSFWDIGNELRTSKQNVMALYRVGIEACCRIANGRSAYPGQPGTDHMAALRERNRAFKRQAAEA